MREDKQSKYRERSMEKCMEGQKVVMTQQAYEELCDRIEHMEYKCHDWYPTLEQAQRLMKNPGNNLEFLLWISETSDQRGNKEKQEVIKTIRQFLYHHLIIEESGA